jgi:hypothetical protein
VDGGTDSSQISWYRNGQHQPIYENLLVLPGSGTSPNEEWYFTVIPSDGMDLGNVESSPIVLVGEAIQEIFLYAGWNLVSIYLQIPDTDILSVLASIDGLYSSVSTYDADMARWMQYNPDGPDFLNDLDTIEPGRGYFIHMLTDATLTVTGEQIANTTIVLRPGQNLVGYNSSRPQLREDVQLPVECISIWTYDAASGIWLRHATSGPNTHNHLTELEPGKGYTIYVSDDTTWTVSP